MDLKSELRKELSRTRMNLVALSRGIDKMSDLAGSLPDMPKVEDRDMIQLVCNVFKLKDESSISIEIQASNSQRNKGFKGGCPHNHEWDIPLTKKILNKVAALLEESGISILNVLAAEVKKKNVVQIGDEQGYDSGGQGPSGSRSAVQKKRKIANISDTDTMTKAVVPAKFRRSEVKDHFARGVDDDDSKEPKAVTEVKHRFARGVDDDSKKPKVTLAKRRM